MTQPLVSAIVPCYNAEATVRDSIDSLLAQTYPHVEVIAVDDGSTDSTLEALRSYGDRIRVIAQQNAGACSARNHGLREARGELIQFLDSDDVITNEKIESQVPLLMERPAAMAVCGYRILDIMTNEPVDSWAPPATVPDSVQLAASRSTRTETMLHWRSNLEAADVWDESLPCSQERDLHLRLTCRGISFLPTPGIHCTGRRRAGSVSSDALKVLLQHERIFSRALSLLEVQQEDTPERRLAFARALALDARQLLAAGLRQDADRYIALAGTIHPEGLPSTYPGWQRGVFRILGPVATERLIGIRRKLAARG